jgi:hypothetical protein
MSIAIVLAAAMIAVAGAGNRSLQESNCGEGLCHMPDNDASVVSLLQVQTTEGSAAMAAAMAEVRAAVAATVRLRRKYGHVVAKTTWHSALDQVTSAIQQVRSHQQVAPSAPIGTGPLPVGPLPPVNVLKSNPQAFAPPSHASMQQQKPKDEKKATPGPPAATPAKEVATQAPVVARIAPFGKEDTATELTKHAERTQDTLVDAVENAEVAEVKRAVFRALTRLRAASIKEFDTIARLETQAIDEYNDAHHYRAENPLSYIHQAESEVAEDKYTSFH